MTEPDPHWVDRLQATGRAQARYLWVLFVLCLFYAALFFQVRNTLPDNLPDPTMPVVGISLSTRLLLASGPAVISFLVIVVTGALRAFSNAEKQLGIEPHEYGTERLDTHPNAIDLAVYTTKESHFLLKGIAYHAYPAFLAAALAEAMWLGFNLYAAPKGVYPARTVFILLGSFLGLIAIVQVITMWLKRIKKQLAKSDA